MYIYFVYINPSSVSAKLPACSSEKLLVWVEDIIILCLFPSVQCVHALRGFTRQGDDRMLEGKLETPPPLRRGNALGIRRCFTFQNIWLVV